MTDKTEVTAETKTELDATAIVVIKKNSGKVEVLFFDSPAEHAAALAVYLSRCGGTFVIHTEAEAERLFADWGARPEIQERAGALAGSTAGAGLRYTELRMHEAGDVEFYRGALGALGFAEEIWGHDARGAEVMSLAEAIEASTADDALAPVLSDVLDDHGIWSAVCGGCDDLGGLARYFSASPAATAGEAVAALAGRQSCVLGLPFEGIEGYMAGVLDVATDDYGDLSDDIKYWRTSRPAEVAAAVLALTD